MITLSAGVEFGIAREKMVDEKLSDQLRSAVYDFIKDSSLGRGVDPEGYYEATREAMAHALMGQGELWVGQLGGELVIYILAVMTLEVDHRPTYWVSQAWVRKDQRGLPWVKQAWETIRRRAVQGECAHIVAISGRDNNEAYCRFLGKGWHIYGTLLKEDLNGQSG